MSFIKPRIPKKKTSTKFHFFYLGLLTREPQKLKVKSELILMTFLNFLIVFDEIFHDTRKSNLIHLFLENSQGSRMLGRNLR